jgi:hypothetical protein
MQVRELLVPVKIAIEGDATGKSVDRAVRRALAAVPGPRLAAPRPGGRGPGGEAVPRSAQDKGL